MKMVKLATIFAAILSLVGCSPKQEPFMLDGPGMVYYDREYRNVYANVLATEDDALDMWDTNSCAIAYLGKGAEGEANCSKLVNKVFADLSKEEKQEIGCYEFEGDDWFFVVPRYKDIVDVSGVVILEDGTKETVTEIPCGIPFAIKGRAKISSINRYPIDLILEVNDDNKLEFEDVWDITDYENLPMFSMPEDTSGVEENVEE